MPAAFSYVKTAPASPLYPRALGLVLVGCYALLLGGGGTLAEPAMLVFADTVDAPGAAERSPLRRNLLIATTAAGVAVRASPLALALASSPLERVQTSSTLRPTVAASSYLRLQPQALLRLQVGLLLSLLKLLLHLSFLALLLPFAAVAGALSTQARPRSLALPHDHRSLALPHDHHATPRASQRLPHAACFTPLAHAACPTPLLCGSTLSEVKITCLHPRQR